MLAFERWTLTQSSGWAAVLVGLALALGLLLGLEAMNASRVAETVAAGELGDDDGDAEPVWDGEPVGDVDAADADADDGVPEPAFALGLDGGGEFGVLLGVVPPAGAVGEAEVDDEDGVGVGVGVFVGWVVGVGGGGVGVLVTGRTTHVVAVFALALAEALAVVVALLLALAEALVLVLAEALVLGEAAAALTVPARAAPGQPATTPRVRNPPASKLSTAARTYARRMNIALSTLLIEVTVCSSWDSEATG
jgi:hypothetical protein